jgi:acetyltransferase-like isoleucine patch superfamily enzyme
MNRIAETAKIYPLVKIGRNVTIEDFCIIGVPFKGHAGEETFIGDNAVIRSHTVIYAGTVIGNDFQTGNKANIRELNRIGNDVSIGTLTVLEHHIEIADGVRIHSQAFIPEYSVLKQGCWIGPNVVLTNAKYPRSPMVKERLQGPVVEERAKIGANSTILPGVTVGKNALVGAGSVVAGTVEENTIVAGNPAHFIRKIDY